MTRGDLRRLREAVAKMTPGPLQVVLEDGRSSLQHLYANGDLSGPIAHVSSWDGAGFVLLRNHAEALVEIAQKGVRRLIRCPERGSFWCDTDAHLLLGEPLATLCDCDPAEVDAREI